MVLNFAFHPLCAAKRRRVRGFRRGLFERVARVPQPPDQSSNAGNRAAAANWGRLLFGYFFLAKQEKVTSCRATPDGFDFDSDVGYRYAQPNLRPPRMMHRIQLPQPFPRQMRTRTG